MNIPIRDFELYVSRQVPENATGTIVFLHDSLGCTSVWRDFPQQLGVATGYATLTYDRRGYGLSSALNEEARSNDYMENEADILIELLDHYQIERPVLFGHSDGGTIALLAAAKYPEKIGAVITEGAHVFVEEITLDGIERAKELYASGLKERLEKHHGANTQAMFEAWTETWLSAAYRDWNIEYFLPQINCPLLVIQGSEDEYGSYAQVQAIVGQVSGPSEICMVINAGHSPHKQNTLWLIDRCCTFMDTYDLV